MDAVMTAIAKNKVLRTRAGEMALPKVAGFAFGGGGIDASGYVLAPNSEANTLNKELIRKPIDRYEFISDTRCRYYCTIPNDELAGEKISELALYDEEGDLIAIKNFVAKTKDGDLEMLFQIDDIF